MKYKTSEDQRKSLKTKRDAIKAAGGEPYEVLLKKERAARAEFRKRHPDQIRADHKRREKTRPGWHKRRLLMAARRRGRKAGLPATIRTADLFWPTHCPVLGIELDYSTVRPRKWDNPANPSLDRWDNLKGYVPGNVFVISMRANCLKNNANPDELDAVARYARHGLPSGALPDCGGS